jgi:hypothetical protein
MPSSNAQLENTASRIQLPEIEEVPKADGERADGGVDGGDDGPSSPHIS